MSVKNSQLRLSQLMLAMVLDSAVLYSKVPRPLKPFSLLLQFGKNLCSGSTKTRPTLSRPQLFHMVRDILEFNWPMQLLSFSDHPSFTMFLRQPINMSQPQFSLNNQMANMIYLVDWLLETPGTNITISRYTLTVLLTTLLFNQLIYMLTIFSLIQQFMIFILRRLVSPLLEYIDINKSPLTRATQVFL